MNRIPGNGMGLRHLDSKHRGMVPVPFHMACWGSPRPLSERSVAYGRV